MVRVVESSCSGHAAGDSPPQHEAFRLSPDSQLRAELRERVERHRERGRPILQLVERLDRQCYGTLDERDAARAEAAAIDPAAFASLLVMTVMSGGSYPSLFNVGTLVPDAGLPLEPADVELVVTAVRNSHARQHVLPYGYWTRLPWVVDVIEAYCAGRPVESVEPWLREALLDVEAQLDLWSTERTELRSRLRRLLPRPAMREAADATVFDDRDDWGLRARVLVESWPQTPPADLDDFLLHLDVPRVARPRPTLAWMARAREFADAAGAMPLVRCLLDEALASEVRVHSEPAGDVPLYLTGANGILLRSLVWVAALYQEPWWLELARPLILRADAEAYGGPAPSAKVARAGVEMLRDVDPAAAIEVLEGVRGELTHPQVAVDVDRMLVKLGARSKRKGQKRSRTTGVVIFKGEDLVDGVEVGPLFFEPGIAPELVEDRWYARDEAQQLADRVGYALDFG
jgi:hypothetical protein